MVILHNKMGISTCKNLTYNTNIYREKSDIMTTGKQNPKLIAWARLFANRFNNTNQALKVDRGFNLTLIDVKTGGQKI